MITPVYVLNTLIVLGIVVSAVLTVTAKRTLSSIIFVVALRKTGGKGEDEK